MTRASFIKCICRDCSRGKFGRSSKPPDRDQRFTEQNRLPGEKPSGNTSVCGRGAGTGSGKSAWREPCCKVGGGEDLPKEDGRRNVTVCPVSPRRTSAWALPCQPARSFSWRRCLPSRLFECDVPAWRSRPRPAPASTGPSARTYLGSRPPMRTGSRENATDMHPANTKKPEAFLPGSVTFISQTGHYVPPSFKVTWMSCRLLPSSKTESPVAAMVTV